MSQCTVHPSSTVFRAKSTIHGAGDGCFSNKTLLKGDLIELPGRLAGTVTDSTSEDLMQPGKESINLASPQPHQAGPQTTIYFAEGDEIRPLEFEALIGPGTIIRVSDSIAEINGQVFCRKDAITLPAPKTIVYGGPPTAVNEMVELDGGFRITNEWSGCMIDTADNNHKYCFSPENDSKVLLIGRDHPASMPNDAAYNPNPFKRYCFKDYKRNSPNNNVVIAIVYQKRGENELVWSGRVVFRLLKDVFGSGHSADSELFCEYGYLNYWLQPDERGEDDVYRVARNHLRAKHLSEANIETIIAACKKNGGLKYVQRSRHNPDTCQFVGHTPEGATALVNKPGRSERKGHRSLLGKNNQRGDGWVWCCIDWLKSQAEADTSTSGVEPTAKKARTSTTVESTPARAKDHSTESSDASSNRSNRPVRSLGNQKANGSMPFATLQLILHGNLELVKSGWKISLENHIDDWEVSRIKKKGPGIVAQKAMPSQTVLAVHGGTVFERSYPPNATSHVLLIKDMNNSFAINGLDVVNDISSPKCILGAMANTANADERFNAKIVWLNARSNQDSFLCAPLHVPVLQLVDDVAAGEEVMVHHSP